MRVTNHPRSAEGRPPNRHKLILLVCLSTAALVAAAAAVAGTLTPTASITGTAGISLSLPGDPSISSTLDGTDLTASYSAVLGVVDARGTGSGWNLQISATAFSDGQGHSLAAGVLSAASAACHAGSSCTAPSNGLAPPITLSTTAAKFFQAAVNSGLGKIDVTPTVTVSIPGNAYQGTYSSTVTLSATTGP